MSEFFSMIYAWIVLQFSKVKQRILSLFTRKSEESNSETIDNHLNHSENLNEIVPNTSSSIAVTTTGEIEEIEKDTLAELEETEIDMPLEEPEKDTIPAELEEIVTHQPAEPLYDGKYDSIFNTPEIPILQSVVNEEIWDVIYEKLPENYTIPSNPSSILYKKQTY